MSDENQKAPESTEAPDGTAALKKELDDTKNKYLYLLADFDNFRKQSIKERSDLLKFGTEPIIREMLSVLDNLELASNTDIKADKSDSVEAYTSGVRLIVEQLKKSLQKFGVEPVESIGTVFDPSQHEALTSEENPELAPNTVSQVHKKGYKLHGKLIRPAQVVVNTIKQ